MLPLFKIICKKLDAYNHLIYIIAARKFERIYIYTPNVLIWIPNKRHQSKDLQNKIQYIWSSHAIAVNIKSL